MKDPVCGMDVAEPPKIQTTLNNQVYGFCNLGCKAKFESDPQRYLNSVPAGMEESKFKTFLPLIMIFSAVLAFSIGGEIYHGSWQELRFMENFMAAFFIIFGGLKVLNIKGFVEAYQTYDIVAKKIPAYGYIYAFLEVALGISYLFRWNLNFTNWVTLIVMLISSIGVAQALCQGKKIQCACLGAIFKIPMTKVTLLEDVLMGLMALSMIMLYQQR